MTAIRKHRIRLTSPTCFLSAKLEGRLEANSKGNAVFARETIEKGELLAVWGGRLITLEDFEALSVNQRRLALQVEDNLFMLTEHEGPADWVNHSCDPNAGLVGQISLIAMRTIEAGEEICFDYAMTDSTPYDEFECQCGAENCRRRVSGSDWRLEDLQRRYKGFFSSYIQRKINGLDPAIR